MTGRPVILAAHDPQWSGQAAQESARISDILRSILAAIYHIGSTAIPGMKAKPIIDLLGVVTDLEALDLQTFALSEIGYLPRGEFGIPGKKRFHFPHRKLSARSWRAKAMPNSSSSNSW